MSLESQEAPSSPRALQERPISPTPTSAPPSKSAAIEVELARLNQEVLSFKGCRIDKRNDAALLKELQSKVKKNKAMLETLAVRAPMLLLTTFSSLSLTRTCGQNTLPSLPFFFCLSTCSLTQQPSSFYSISSTRAPSFRTGTARRRFRDLLPVRRAIS